MATNALVVKMNSTYWATQLDEPASRVAVCMDSRRVDQRPGSASSVDHEYRRRAALILGN
jgi:hypothetical protein